MRSRAHRRFSKKQALYLLYTLQTGWAVFFLWYWLLCYIRWLTFFSKWINYNYSSENLCLYFMAAHFSNEQPFFFWQYCIIKLFMHSDWQLVCSKMISHLLFTSKQPACMKLEISAARQFCRLGLTMDFFFVCCIKGILKKIIEAATAETTVQLCLKIPLLKMNK